MAGDPLYSARRTLHTGADLLTDKQKVRLNALFADDNHLQVEVTWTIYQHMIAAYPTLTAPPDAPEFDHSSTASPAVSPPCWPRFAGSAGP